MSEFVNFKQHLKNNHKRCQRTVNFTYQELAQCLFFSENLDIELVFLFFMLQCVETLGIGYISSELLTHLAQIIHEKLGKHLERQKERHGMWTKFQAIRSGALLSTVDSLN